MATLPKTKTASAVEIIKAEIEWREIGALTAHPKNGRTHPAAQPWLRVRPEV